MAQTLSIRGLEAGLRGREREIMLAQALVERLHGLDRAVGSESKTMTWLKWAATCSKPVMTAFITLMNHAGETLMPWGMTSHPLEHKRP